MLVSTDNISLLKITGDDALSFLQGQLTNDIKTLANTWQFSGYCNPKGRLLALLQLWREGESIYALIDSSLLEATIKRLRMYVMRSKVTIDVVETALVTGELNQENTRFSIHKDSNTRLLNYGDRTLRVDFEKTQVDYELAESNSAWHLSSIDAAEPTINADNAELFVPQMVNLDLLDGINFKKGCYTGQEIVARMHYLGKLKQRMFVCDIENDETSTPIAGEKVVSVIDGVERNAGNLVSFTEGKALAVLRTEMIASPLKCESGGELIVNERQAYEIPDLS